MRIEKFTISNDPTWYEAWPDVTLTPAGRLVCVFNECVHHGDRSRTRIVQCDSEDRGRTWSAKRAVTEATAGLPYSYNCPRLTQLRDGRLALVVDRVPAVGEKEGAAQAVNVLYFSGDDGKTWGAPVALPLRGIVPSKLTELENGRWLLAAHYPVDGCHTQWLRYSDDQGATWSESVLVAHDERYQLCEASLLPLGGGEVVAFLRENSMTGLDCMKCVSHDNGESWGPVVPFPLPGCHRPVAGVLQDGTILITYRFCQGGRGWLGHWTQNFFGAQTDRRSALSVRRGDAATRIFPIDYDRSPKSDLGYSGWVQFPDGEVYVVNYIVDDAVNNGQIRGYALELDPFS